jgi:fatty acid synthase
MARDFVVRNGHHNGSLFLKTSLIKCRAGRSLLKNGHHNGSLFLKTSLIKCRAGRSLLANRISFFFGLTGPSLVMDSACSSAAYALDCAYTAMRFGECDSALVCGANILSPKTSDTYINFGVLSMNGLSCVFDEKADGFIRAEAASVLFLQRAKDAKRIYATIVHSKTNAGGNNDKGIFHPSVKMQTELMMKFYQELNMDPSIIKYVEAHATSK